MGRLRTKAFALLPVVLLLALLCGHVASISAQPQPGGKVIVLGPGGTYQAALEKAHFEPFEKLTGIKVLFDSSQAPEYFEAQVKTGRPNFDLADDDYSTQLILERRDLLAPIDYKYYDPADLRALPPATKGKFGVGSAWISLGMSYSLQAFPKGGPKNWAEFWDVRKFPGKRAMPACDQAEGTQPLAEAAALAGGVPMNKVYPINVPLALKKIKELAPHVIWYKSNAQPGQLMVAREATLALAASGRINQLVVKGAPLRYLWNQSRYSWNMWRVAKGAPNMDNAMRFLAFAARPDPQAHFARMTTYGPNNPRAVRLLTPAEAALTPTAAANLKVSFAMSDPWWAENRDKFIEACFNTVGR